MSDAEGVKNAENPEKTSDSAAPAGAEPLLLRLRSGRIAAAVVAFGFGGGTLLLGGITLTAGALEGGSPWGGVIGYLIAASPFFLGAWILALCKSELWFLPEGRSLRLLTYRPWLRTPRVEEASLDEYAGVRVEPPPDQEGGPVVALVSVQGEAVPVRQFSDAGEAEAFARRVAAATGLWLRGSEGAAA